MGHANLKFWKAWEDRDVVSGMSRRMLVVTGKVEVDDMQTPILDELDAAAKLKDEIERRGEPKTLQLQFSVLKPGKSWKIVWFQKEIKSGDYKTVHLRDPRGIKIKTLVLSNS